MKASNTKPMRQLVWRKIILFGATLALVALSIVPSSSAAALGSQKAPVLLAQCYPVSSPQCGGTPSPSPSPNPSPNPNPNPSTTATDCSASGGLSWALCPLTELIVQATTFIEQTLILPYLTVSPLSTDSGSPVFRLWGTVRNIANILFILAFFFIIFSQATSIGLSNYGVKRMLPRLVWVAIVANLSYYLVAFAIDAFNIFGAGVAQLVMGILSTGGAGSGQGTDVAGFWKIAVPLTVLGIGVSMGWIWSLLGAILLIILIAVVVLVLRQMLILLLVVLSPLLAVAELLPNTQKYADKGWSALFKLLLMYPLIVLVFAIGNIIGALLSSGDIQLANGQAASKEVSDIIKQVFIALAKAAPLLLLPSLFAAAGQLLNSAHNFVRTQSQNIANRGQQAYQNSNYAKYREQQKQEREQQIASGNYVARSNWSRINPAHYMRKTRSFANRGLNQWGFGNTLTGGFGAQQALQNTRQRAEARSATQKYFNDDYELAEAWLKSGGNVGSSEFKGLTTARQNTFRQMSNSGLGRSGDSYIAAMELVANSGRGNEKMAQDAFARIRKLDPATGENDVAALATNLRATWRKTGRGDLAGADQNALRPLESFTSENIEKGHTSGESAWKDISFEHFTRHVMDSVGAPGGETSLRKFLRRDTNTPERMRKIVEALPKMEARARERMEGLIHDMYKAQPTLTGVTFSGSANYALTRAEFLDQLRQEFKLVPK